MIESQKEEILARLIGAFQNRNEKEFKYLLEKYCISSDVSLEILGINMSIIEYVLQTPNSSNFINICLEYSSSVSKRNSQGHYLMHYAVQSMCANNLIALLHHLDQLRMAEDQLVCEKMMKRSDAKSNKNHLHEVIEKLATENHKECVKIIGLLLDYGCNPNHLNADSKSPFELLLDMHLNNLNENEDMIKMFRNLDLEVDDSYKEQVLSLKLENVKYRSEKNCGIDYLTEQLKQGNEKEFIEALRSINPSEIATNFYSLMKSSIEMNFAKAVPVLLECSKKVSACDMNKHEDDILIQNFSSQMIEQKTPLFYALSLCRHEIVKELLKLDCVKFHNGSNSRNVLHEICSLENIESNDDFLKCFKLIIMDERCGDNVINGFDSNKKTPLMYACENHHRELERELIRRDAYIGYKCVLKNLHEAVLRQQLDESIVPTTSLCDQNCMVQLNYKFLIPQKYSNKRIMEMEALQLIAAQSKYQNLLTHPVLTSFLELKWKRVNFLTYAALIFYLFFFLYLSIFILSFFNHSIYDQKDIARFSSRFGASDDSSESDETLRNTEIIKVLFSGRKKRDTSEEQSITMASYIKEHKTTYIISLFGTFILTISELVQLIFTWKRYFFKLSNWVDCSLLGLAYIVLLCSFGGPDTLRKLRAVLFLVIALQCFILISRVSKLSLHFEIFKKVGKTFLKFIMLYFMLIFAFAMAFYTLFGHTQDDLGSPSDEDTAFQDILMSTITVIRMMLSDFEGVKLKPGEDFNAFMFLLFILLITIILFNLLNALAIADTQQIMISAEIVDVRKRIRMISTCERILAFLKIDFFNIYSNQIQDGRIFLNINKDGYVRIKTKVNEDNRVVVRYSEVSVMQCNHIEKSKYIGLNTIGDIESNKTFQDYCNCQICYKMFSRLPECMKRRNLRLGHCTIKKIIEHMKT